MDYSAINRITDAMSRRGFLAGAGVLAGAVAAAGASTPLAAADIAWGDTLPQATGDAAPPSARKILTPYATPSVIFEEEMPRQTKRVLIVVDYQVDFVDGGVFGTIEPALAIEEGICEVIEEYRANDDLIIYTMDSHPSDHYDETREGTFNPPHCIPGTEGWELYGKVRNLLSPDNAIQVKKGTYGSRDLPAVLNLIMSQGVSIDMIEFAGVSTTCRVLHNAIIVYNFFPEIPLVFNAKSTASYSDEMTRSQLEELEGWGFIVKW